MTESLDDSSELVADLQSKMRALETELRILETRHVALSIAFVTLQLIAGAFLFIGCIYIILQPYLGLPVQQELPTFTNVVAACALVLALYWVYRANVALKILLLEKQRAKEIVIRARDAIDDAMHALSDAESSRSML